jgi:hypothetical protein
LGVLGAGESASVDLIHIALVLVLVQGCWPVCALMKNGLHHYGSRKEEANAVISVS